MLRAPRKAALVGFTLALGGCALEAPPSTLKVDGLAPHEVDLGDRLEISGAGFPLRRVAHVRFVGRLLHPGAPAEAADFEVDVEARSEGRLTLLLDEPLVARFTGRGDRAAHATFRGEVRVTFDPVEVGTAKLTGSAPTVVLDVRPGALIGRSEARLATEGARLLAWMGVVVADQAPASGGLTVKSVAVGSPADTAGLGSGDTIAELDGLQVFRLSDLAPARDVVSLSVRRPAETTPRLVVLRPPGLAERVPRDLLLATLGSAFLALLALLPFSRAPGLLAALGRDRTLTRARPSTLELGAVIGVAALSTLALRLAPADLDVAAVFLVSAFACVACGSLDRRASLVRGVTDHLPGAVAVVTTVVVTGSLRLSDLAATQGAKPWEWALTRTPTTGLLLVGWALALARAEAPRSTATRAAQALHLGAFGTLGAVLFLGGAGTLEADATRSLAASLLAAGTVLALKALALGALVWAARALSAGRSLSGALAIALLGAGATLGWSGLSLGDRLRGLSGPVVTAVLATVALVAVLEGLYAARRVTAQHVDPHT